MTDNRKTTVPGASVGADAVQSSDKITTNIITNSGKQINLQAAKKCHLSRVNAQKSKNIFYDARMRAISSRKSCSEHR